MGKTPWQSIDALVEPQDGGRPGRAMQDEQEQKQGWPQQAKGQGIPFALRAADVSIALAGIAFGLPFYVLYGRYARGALHDSGIFKQERIGRHGDPFIIYKFRTLKRGAPQTNDRKQFAAFQTRVGRVMRRFFIDELPNLINVLKAEMSVVGYRPAPVGGDFHLDSRLHELRQRKGIYTLPCGIINYGTFAMYKGRITQDKKIVADRLFAMHYKKHPHLTYARCVLGVAAQYVRLVTSPVLK